MGDSLGNKEKSSAMDAAEKFIALKKLMAAGPYVGEKIENQVVEAENAILQLISDLQKLEGELATEKEYRGDVVDKIVMQEMQILADAQTLNADRLDIPQTDDRNRYRHATNVLLKRINQLKNRT